MASASPLVLLVLLSLFVAGAVSKDTMSSINYQKTDLDLSQVAGKTHFVVDGQKSVVSCASSCRMDTHCMGFGFRNNGGAVKGDNCVLIQSDGAQNPPASYMGYHYYSTVEEPTKSCRKYDVGDVGTYSGWMVVQRRIDGCLNFYRDWAEYKAGFGDPAGEFWLGNDKLHELTKDGDYRLRVELENYGLPWFSQWKCCIHHPIKILTLIKKENWTLAAAEYDTFIVGDELSNYILTVTGFQGSTPPGDSLSVVHQNRAEFSTKDRDNDLDNDASCAAMYKGGWWYGACHSANLNGLYGSTIYGEGINWFTWTGFHNTLSAVRMMIKRK